MGIYATQPLKVVPILSKLDQTGVDDDKRFRPFVNRFLYGVQDILHTGWSSGIRDTQDMRQNLLV